MACCWSAGEKSEAMPAMPTLQIKLHKTTAGLPAGVSILWLGLYGSQALPDLEPVLRHLDLT